MKDIVGKVIDLDLVTENSILIVSGKVNVNRRKELDELVLNLEGRIPDNALICLAEEGVTIELFSEDIMRSHGWVREK